MARVKVWVRFRVLCGVSLGVQVELGLWFNIMVRAIFRFRVTVRCEWKIRVW